MVKTTVPTPLGLLEMYTGPSKKGKMPVFIGELTVTTGLLVAVVMYEYSSV